MRDIIIGKITPKTPQFQLLKVKEDIYIIAKYAVETGDFHLLNMEGRYSSFKQCNKCKEYLPATGNNCVKKTCKNTIISVINSGGYR